jgi:single-strand DNA-binding protein
MNSIIIMGRLTDNPELRKTPNDISVTSFSVAVDRNYRSGSERITDFFNCTAWRGTAEFISKYFAKGQMIAIEGSMQSRRYDDKDGNKRTAWEIQVNQAHFCGGKNEGGNAGFSRGDSGASFANSGADDFSEITADDDLPF